MTRRRSASLRSTPITVVADDGVPAARRGRRARPTSRTGDAPRAEHGATLTVVFCHGYALNLDCWHFQRAAYRGLVRTVYYDQRSHGRSGRSPDGHATIDQLGHDLAQRHRRRSCPRGRSCWSVTRWAA